MSFDADFSTRVAQSSMDKLLNSTTYPLTISEKSESFPGCDLALYEEGDPIYRFSIAEVSALLSRAVSESGASNSKEAVSTADQMFATGGKIIEQYKKALDASGDRDYEGPAAAELKAVVDGGIENLATTLGDWGVYAWCPYLRVRILDRPSISLGSPRIDLKGFKVQVKATGELWVKYPWLNCYQYCLKWKKVIKCERAASLTVSVTLDADAYIDIIASAASVYAMPKFEKLRLDYDILDQIPLEKLANSGLKHSSYPIFDASKLVAAIPVLESKFRVGSIELPADAGGISVTAQIEQI